jgi:uncharacterized membrane protein YfcA
MSFVVAAWILLAGLAIGAIGIGGVLVVPALTEGAAVPIENAIAASMFGFLLTGIAAIASQRSDIQFPARHVWLLNLAALVGAASGALIMDWLSAGVVKLFVALVAIVSGIHALAGRASQAAQPMALAAPAMVGIGALVGCGSALSGTGGPVMLIPILMILRVPITTAVGLAQVIQVPIALSATGVNAALGRLDLILAMTVACILVVGNATGFWLAKRIGAGTLKKGAAFGLIALGIWYGYATLKQTA